MLATRENAALAIMSGTRCPHCRDSVDVEASVACQDCLARHHDCCWLEGGGCGTCQSTRCLEPREPRPARTRRRPLWLVPAMLLAAVAALILLGAL